MERVFNMILRRLINMGINSGMKAITNRGNRNQKQDPEARQQTRQGQKNARQVRQATRMANRSNKF